VRDHGGGVALTFDDGPSALTPLVLDCLAEHEAVATFFVLGIEAERRPDVLRRMRDGGHEIGMHGYIHTARDHAGQIAQCARALTALGCAPSAAVRPPGGRLSARALWRLWLRGYKSVLFSFDTRDSMRLEGKRPVAAPDYAAIRGGDIVLMHDDNQLCVRELPRLLGAIREKGLRAVTVGKLTGGA